MHWPIGQCAWTPLEWKNTVTWSWQNKTETSMGMPWKNKPERSHLSGRSPLLTYHLLLHKISVMLHLDSWIITYSFNEDRQLGSQLHKQQLWSEGPNTLVDWPREPDTTKLTGKNISISSLRAPLFNTRSSKGGVWYDIFYFTMFG